MVHASAVEHLLVELEDNSHDGKIEDKCERHEVFATWVVETFGQEDLCSGMGVIDIAGGRGQLSARLATRGIPTTLIEPVIRDGGEIQPG